MQGRIQTGSYKDRSGTSVYTTDVITEHIEMLGQRQEAYSSRNDGQGNATQYEQQVAQTTVYSDDNFDSYEKPDEQVPF